MLVHSLRNRIRALNYYWQRAVEDLTLEQVNHHEREGVLPIAFSACHFMRTQDSTITRTFLGRPPLWESGDWAARVGVSVNKIGREETVEEMEQIRFDDLGAWREYQTQVIAATDEALDLLTEELLAEVLIPALPPNMQNVFCARVVGPNNPIRKLDALECFVYQHGLRHLGEVEHGRALVGLRGMTS